MTTPLHENEKIGFLKTCINGINALSGIGILSVSYALSSGGWLSLITLLLIAAIACFTALLISKCMDKEPDGIRSYIDIAGHAFGRKGRIIASIFICIELYFIATGLLIIEGDNLHKLFPHLGLKFGKLIFHGRHFFIIIAGVAVLPSMCLKDLSFLSYVSAGGVLSSLILIVCVLCVGATKDVGFHFKGRLFNLNGIPTALSLYTFCFAAHSVFPPIYNSMRKKSQFPKVLLLCFGICTITYLAMAILGYLIYGQNVQSQITLNLPTEQISAKIAIYAILAGPIAKYALIVMPIVTAIESCLPAKYKDCKTVSILIRMSLLVSTVVLAVLVPSFQSVTSLSGAFLAVAVSFLLPCVFYLKIFKVRRIWGFEFIGIFVIMLLAVFVGVLGTYSSIAQTVKSI